MSAGRRSRKRGTRLPPGKFIPLPVDVVKKATAILTAPELRVFIAICGQSQWWSNGTAMLTRSVISEWHLGSTRTVAAAIRKLLDAKMVVRTRRATQHKAALYAVRYLPLNTDALDKAGVSATTVEALKDVPSATNSGSAVARPQGTSYSDHGGSADGGNGGSARPQGMRKGTFSGIPARPQGTQSKNLPTTSAEIGTPHEAIS